MLLAAYLLLRRAMNISLFFLESARVASLESWSRSSVLIDFPTMFPRMSIYFAVRNKCSQRLQKSESESRIRHLSADQQSGQREGVLISCRADFLAVPTGISFPLFLRCWADNKTHQESSDHTNHSFPSAIVPRIHLAFQKET